MLAALITEMLRRERENFPNVSHDWVGHEYFERY
jgi:hypothetical protein